ncbi:uncharacterized protein PHA67_018517 isoform 1-T1 [Liasis olivaceus]
MHSYTIDDLLMKQRWKKNELTAYAGTLKSDTSNMKFFSLFLAQLVIPCCLAKSVADSYVGRCKSPGELPAPQFFLNGSSVQEGEWVLLQCLHSNEFEVKNFYFCKDGHPLSTPTALLYDGTYKVSLQISQQSAGQYSCGYQSMDRKSQMKKFAHSAARNLTVVSAAVLATPCCLAESVADKYVGQCNSTGELPAPQFFLNGSSVQEGEWVLLQCLHSNEFEVKNFYFCKDGHPLSTPTALVYDGTYKVSLQISQQSAGQYSCGYQSMDRKSQMKKFAHSAAQNLTVVSENELSVFTKGQY